MSYRLIIRRRAEDQITEAYNWYEQKREGLGSEFLLCVESSLNAIGVSPLMFQERYKNIRVVFTPRFPYGVFYFTDENKIVVIAVFHLSRNPKLWRK